MSARAPISVVIPALNAAETLPKALGALAPAAVEGLVREVILVDGGSVDSTRATAEAAGVRVIVTAPGRGGQLAEGAAQARGDWLLFLHADTVLDPGWIEEAAALMRGPDTSAGVFTLAFDAEEAAASIVAAGAMIRTRLFGAPYGDQGLLISRRLYNAVGGFRPLPLMEDVEFVDRLKKHGNLVVFRSRAVTSARRYQRDGYLRRVLKNLWCVTMYRFGVPPERIKAFYQ